MNRLPQDTVLLIIDVQKAIDNPIWSKYGKRNNPSAEENMAAILGLWRNSGRQVIHIRHESHEPDSTYRPGQPSCDFKECVQPKADELIISKQVNSAFIGTNLESILREKSVKQLVVFGVITNNSVETTVRMAGNLGFVTFLVADATFTFAKPDYDGRIRSAEEIHAISLANLADEYCTVISTKDLKAII